MRLTTARNSLLPPALLCLLGSALTGCASSSSGSPAGKLVYQPHYAPQSSATLVAGDTLGRTMFEQGVVVASRANAELRYAGVIE